MSGRPSWDEQFRETEEETRERWARTQAKRKAEGKCWQCAKLIADCMCPNVKHKQARKIVTTNHFPPIPIRTMDWSAHYDGDEESGPRGWGATEAEAIKDLQENYDEV